MSGLFRTTSLSESENGFFRKYMNKHANLCELYMHFKLSMDTQRHDHDSRSLVDQTSCPVMITKLPIEKLAATVYTNDIFLDVQKEIEMAVMFCTIQNKTGTPDVVTYDVDNDAVGLFNIVYNVKEGIISCDCNYFTIYGLVCKHMFVVMKVRMNNRIIDRYILHRWSKKACAIFESTGQNLYASGHMGAKLYSDDLFSLAGKCVGLASRDEEISQDLNTILNDFYVTNADKIEPVNSAHGKLKAIEQYYGSNIPDEASVRQPKTSKTKGSCSRLKSRKETAINRQEKPKRLCQKCLTWGHHDSRKSGKQSEQ